MEQSYYTIGFKPLAKSPKNHFEVTSRQLLPGKTCSNVVPSNIPDHGPEDAARRRRKIQTSSTFPCGNANEGLCFLHGVPSVLQSAEVSSRRVSAAREDSFSGAHLNTRSLASSTLKFKSIH